MQQAAYASFWSIVATFYLPMLRRGLEVVVLIIIIIIIIFFYPR